MIYVIFSESGFHKTYCSYGTNVCFRIFSRCFGFLNEAIFGITVLLRMFVMTHWNISWFPTAFHICTNNCLICQFERFLCLHLLIRRVAYFDTIKSSRVVWGNLEILSTAQIWKKWVDPVSGGRGTNTRLKMGHPVVMSSFFGKTGQTFLSYFIRSSHIYTDFIDVFSLSGEISFDNYQNRNIVIKFLCLTM